MTYNFNNIIDARGSQVGMLQRIYGQNGLLLWEKASQGGDTSEYASQYLTFDIVTGGYIILYAYRETYPDYDASKTIQYSINNGSWISKTSKRSSGTLTDTNYIAVNAGDKVRFKGTNSEYWGLHFHGDATWNISGNIMSLIYGDDFTGKTTLTDNRTFCEVFNEGTTLGAPHLLLDCTNLVLPATTLTPGCYNNMFAGCNITTAPVLPATTLTSGCYGGMFTGCSSLRYIKCLATSVDSTLNTGYWTDGVSSTGTFVKDANTTWPSGTSGIPSGWTIQNA